jgi:hypothetical protein
MCAFCCYSNRKRTFTLSEYRQTEQTSAAMTATALATPAQATFPDSDRTATTGGRSRNSTSSPT